MLAFIFAISLVIAPIYLFIVGTVLYKAKLTDNKEDIAKYEALFEGKRMKNWLALMFSSLFFLRRLVLISLVVFLPKAMFT